MRHLSRSSRSHRPRGLVVPAVAVALAVGLGGCSNQSDASTVEPNEVPRPSTGSSAPSSSTNTATASASAGQTPSVAAKVVGGDLLLRKIEEARQAAGSYQMELTVPFEGQTLKTPYEVAITAEGTIRKATVETGSGPVVVVGQSGAWSAQPSGGAWYAVNPKTTDPMVRSISDVVDSTMLISDPAVTDELIRAGGTFTPMGTVGVGKEIATRFTSALPARDAVKIMAPEVRDAFTGGGAKPVPMELAVDRDGRLLRLVVTFPAPSATGSPTAGAGGTVPYTLTFTRFGEVKVSLPASVNP